MTVCQIELEMGAVAVETHPAFGVNVRTEGRLGQSKKGRRKKGSLAAHFAKEKRKQEWNLDR
jgi:hypothetical protein